MSEDLKSDRDELAVALGDAVKAFRACVDDFSKLAAHGGDAASTAMRQAGAEAVGQLGALSDDAQTRMSRGLGGLTEKAAANPLAALAIAAGAGFVLANAIRGATK